MYKHEKFYDRMMKMRLRDGTAFWAMALYMLYAMVLVSGPMTAAWFVNVAYLRDLNRDVDLIFRATAPGSMFTDGVYTLVVFLVTALTSGLPSGFFVIWATCSMVVLLSQQYESSCLLHDSLKGVLYDEWTELGIFADYLVGDAVILIGSIVLAVMRERLLRRLYLSVGTCGYYKDRYHLGVPVNAQPLSAFSSNCFDLFVPSDGACVVRLFGL